MDSSLMENTVSNLERFGDMIQLEEAPCILQQSPHIRQRRSALTAQCCWKSSLASWLSDQNNGLLRIWEQNQSDIWHLDIYQIWHQSKKLTQTQKISKDDMI